MSTFIIYPNIEQEKIVKAFLEALDIPFVQEDEHLPDHVLEGIARGLADAEAGRTITLDEFKKKFPSSQ